MALSEDQRALLRLLLEQGQSYEDIGSLLGFSVQEVRERASSALTEIGGSDPDARVRLTDYLLGQAEPIGRADAVRELSGDPEALALARKLEAQLTLLAPSANLPELPEARSAAKASAKSAKTGPPTSPAGTIADASAASGDSPPTDSAEPGDGTAATAGVSSPQKPIIAALLAGAAIVVVIVLIATGAFSGGNSSKPSSSETATDTPGQTTASSNDAITRATLAPTNGGNAGGLAILGKIKKTPAFEVNVNGLKKLSGKQVYLVTLYGSDKAAWPLGLMAVDKDGLGRAQYPFDSSLLTGIADGTFNSIDISIAEIKELNQAIVEAKKGKTTPSYVGTSVLRGKIEGTSQPAGSGG